MLFAVCAAAASHNLRSARLDLTQHLKRGNPWTVAGGQVRRLTLPQRRQGKLFSSPNFQKLSRRQTVCTVSFPSLASSLLLRQMETSHQSRGLRKRSIRQVPGYARLQTRHETAVEKSRLNTKYSGGQRNSGSGGLITGRPAEPRQWEGRRR